MNGEMPRKLANKFSANIQHVIIHIMNKSEKLTIYSIFGLHYYHSVHLIKDSDWTYALSWYPFMFGDINHMFRANTYHIRKM